MDTVTTFCDVDDFCALFAPAWRAQLLVATPRQRQRGCGLCLSEVMASLIGFHLSGYRTFKAYYTKHVLVLQRREFPKLVSYSRFVELQQQEMVPLCAYLRTRFGPCTGISFLDATKSAPAITCWRA